ncbi:MAG: YfiR family protein, partial [Planctomycetota bacterium]
SIPAAPIEEIDQAKANKVRAAYLYSFLRFVSWPKTTATGGTRSEFRIAIIGNPKLASIIQRIAERKKFIDRNSGVEIPIVVSSTGQLPGNADLEMLYLATADDHSAFDQWVRRRPDGPVFVVRDEIGRLSSEAFTGTARFVVRGGGVKFDLNLDDARQRGLVMPAKLLSAADRLRSQDAADDTSSKSPE